MLTVPHNQVGFNANNLVEAAEGLKQVVRVAQRLYSSLPDSRKEKNQARSTFERKLNMPPKNNGTIGGMKNVSRAVVDSTVVGSTGGQKNRSMTSSYAIGASNGKRGKGQQKSKVPRSPYLDSISVCFRGSLSLTNSAAGVYSAAIPLAIDTPVASDLSAFIPQLTALGGVFREFRFKRLDVDFVPRLGSTSSGVLAVCVDRDPRAGAVATTNAIIRKDPFFEVDIKQAGSLTWKPIDAEDKRWRYTVDGTRPVEFLSQGTIIIYSLNGEAVTVNVGELFLNVWAEFAIPY